MNKTEIITAVAEKTGLSKENARKAVEAFMETTIDELRAGKKVSLIGFGTFDVQKRKARIGRNPQTGAEVQIPAKSTVRFKAGSTLKF